MRTIALYLFLTILLTARPAASAENSISLQLGSTFPDLTVETLLAPEDYRSLGLRQTNGPVALSAIGGELLILEFFNRYCLTCWHMAPQLETFSALQEPGGLGQRVKILSIGAGNNVKELEEFRREFKISYAMAPDPMFDLFYQLGDLAGTPTTFFLLRQEERWVIGEVHTGFYGDVALLARARVLLRTRDQPAPEPSRATASVGAHSVANQEMVRQFLSRVVGSSVQLKMLDLGDTRFLFQAVDTDQRPLEMYGRVARRNPVCDLCHPITFLIAFDGDRAVRGFEAVHVTKFGNALWEEQDTARLRSRLITRSVFDLPFDPDLDAVTSATMSSALIFDEIRRSGEYIKRLNGF